MHSGGLAGVAIGAVTFFRPGITALALVYLIAGWAIITGVFEVVAAVDLHGEVRSSWWLGISGVLSILFGALIAIQPGAGVLAILWVIGFYAILAGVMRLVYAFRVHNVQSTAREVIGGLEAAVADLTPPPQREAPAAVRRAPPCLFGGSSASERLSQAVESKTGPGSSVAGARRARPAEAATFASISLSKRLRWTP